MSAASRERFTGAILAGHKEAAVEVPFDPARRWNRGSVQLRPGRRGHRVTGVIAGVAFVGVVVPRSRRFWLVVGQDQLARAGGAVGDTVAVEIEPAESAGV
ncbi:MAG: DUF1905 domain-containing protein [Casimicrobiaceae bacterium]